MSSYSMFQEPSALTSGDEKRTLMSFLHDEEEPVEYKVQLMGTALDGCLLQLSTFGEWSIEGNFICVWTAAGTKEAYLMPRDVQYINTVEVAQGKHTAEESEDGESTDVADASSDAADAIHNG